MTRLTQSLIVASLLGQAVGLLGWLEPLFIPLILTGPILTGAVAASRRISYAWVAVLWCSAGLNMLWTDWVINNEDQIFHAALSVLMPLFAGIGWGIVRLATRGRQVTATSSRTAGPVL